MKKSAFLALACAALMSATATAQETPEITYTSDPSQGYLFNRFKDNWFITAEGGVNYQFSKTDIARKWSDRFAPAAGLYVGKWFSPVMAFRGGFSYMGTKGLSNLSDAFGLCYNGGNGPVMYDNKYYKTHVYNFGVSFDAMLNLTNWWCGYKPNRVYNCYAYVGGGAYFGMQQGVKEETGTYSKDGLDTKSINIDSSLGLRGGIINSFTVSKQVALALDIRYTALSANKDGDSYNSINSNVSAFLSLTYLFNTRTWNAPIVPVIPAIPTCDEYKAQLAEANTKIADLQKKLTECLNRPAQVVEAPAAVPVATFYFPVGSSRLNRVDANVLKAVAAEINANPNASYDVIGWADTFTGTDAINARLRTNRANAVVNQLVKSGVSKTRLNTKSGEGNRMGDNRDKIYLDRCATIEEVK